MNKFIIASSHPDAGLSNRLKCLISVLRLAEKFDRIPLLHWTRSFTCGGKFQELFDTQFLQIDDDQLKRLISRSDVVRCETYKDVEKSDAKFIILDNWRFITFPRDIKGGFTQIYPSNKMNSIDLEYERIPKKLCKEYLKYINWLVPTKEIDLATKNFIKGHKNFKNSIGLHIRRAEFLLNKDGRGRVSKDENFYEEINNILIKNPQTQFFLATDSKETEKKFLNKFGKRIIILLEKNWDKSTSESTKNALVEMLLLSKTRMILGTYLSTFTEMAWWFGNCRQKVEIMGDEDEKKRVLTRVLAGNEKQKISPVNELLKNIRRESKLFRKMIDSYMRVKNRGYY